MWQATPHCIMWIIWREKPYFEDEEISTQDIKHSFLRMLFEFCTMIGGVLCSSIVDFFGLYNVRL